MKELLVEEDHDEVDEGRDDNEDRHHPGEGVEQVNGRLLLREHVAQLHLLGVPLRHI